MDNIINQIYNLKLYIYPEQIINHKLINIEYQPSIRSDYMGIFVISSEIISKGTCFILMEIKDINEIEDPLFPITEIMCTDSSIFELVLLNTIKTYIKNKNSKIYNVNLYSNSSENVLIATQDIYSGQELLIYKNIGYWLLELLRVLPITHHLIWMKVVKSIPHNNFHINQLDIINRLCSDIIWQNKMVFENPKLKNNIPKLHIEYNVLFLI